MVGPVPRAGVIARKGKSEQKSITERRLRSLEGRGGDVREAFGRCRKEIVREERTDKVTEPTYSGTPIWATRFFSIESMENEKSRIISFLKRRPTLKKKAEELAKLCDVSVCLLCYAPDGKLDIWPENQEEVKGIISRYEGLGDKEKHRRQLDLTSFVDSKRKKLETKKMKKVKKRWSINWDERLDALSREKLTCLEGYLDSTLQILKEKEARATTGW